MAERKGAHHRGNRARATLRKARTLLDRDELKDALAFTQEDADQLCTLSRTYKRGSATMVRAIELRLDRAYGRPTQAIDHNVNVTVNLGARLDAARRRVSAEGESQQLNPGDPGSAEVVVGNG